MRTFFHDFQKDNGMPVTVEFGFSAGSLTTYSPRFGADGGDPAEATILKVWPNNPDYDRLFRELWDWEKKDIRFLSGQDRDTIAELRERVEAEDAKATLTDAERDRMESWLAENFVDDSEPEPVF